MKKLVLFTLMFVFSVASIIPAAFAFECDMMKKGEHSGSMEMEGDMPCHDMQKEPNPTEPHCEGLCMCLHIMVNQAQLYPDSYVLLEPYAILDVFAFGDETVFSSSTSPPFKPPIQLS